MSDTCRTFILVRLDVTACHPILWAIQALRGIRTTLPYSL